METRNILTTQKDVAKNWKDSFKPVPCDEGIKHVYMGGMTSQLYCEFMRLDYDTVARLGVVNYGIEYNCVEGNKYILRCETYIDGCVNERLSMELEDTEDYLGFYQETVGYSNEEEGTDTIAEFFKKSAEEVKEYLEENYEYYSELEELFRAEVDEEEVAEDYIRDNPSHAFSTALEFMSDYDKRDAIKDAIDGL